MASSFGWTSPACSATLLFNQTQVTSSIRKLPAAARLFALPLRLCPPSTQADELADCVAGDGTLFLTTVIAKPMIGGGKSFNGIGLTHAHIRVCGDDDGKVYDLAMRICCGQLQEWQLLPCL